MIQFKCRDDEWQVYGPKGELRTGEITVHKKSGETTTVWIDRVLPARANDGVKMAYGLIGHAPTTSAVVTTDLPCPGAAPAVDAPWVCDGRVAIGRGDSTAGDMFTGRLNVLLGDEPHVVAFDPESVTTIGWVGGVRIVAVTVSETSRSTPRRRSRAACDECGRPRPASRLIECEDSSGLAGRCCSRCAGMARYERSFA